LLDEFGRAIFLEEDIVTAPGFLTFMNEAIEYYKDNPRIFSISGYAPPIKIPENYRHDVYFLRRFNAWGFGTWKDRFSQIKYISPNDYEQFTADRKQVREFVNGGGADMLRMLKRDAYGETDAGDVKAMYAQFLSDQYTVYPVQSLVQNIGHDGTGEHCGVNDRFDVKLWGKMSGFEFITDIQHDRRILKENQKFRAISIRSSLGKVAAYIGIYHALKRVKNIVLGRS
jgi:hypothetical protein